MKKIIRLTLGLLAGAVALGVHSSTAQAANETKVLRHVVMFKFKDDAKPEDVKKVEEAFAQLPSKIDTITGFEWGTDVSVEDKAQGFTHCFVVTFKNEEGRAAYLPHPAHKAFVSVLLPHLDKVLVFDFWAAQ